MTRLSPGHRLSISSLLWNAWCIGSIIGIWPRFIEPNLLGTTALTLQLPNLPAGLHGLKVLQFSDLHLCPALSERFLKKIERKIMGLKPDLILFTGDFLCQSTLDEPARLQHFLCSLSAPMGCYAILGNHDYQEYVSINAIGDYDVADLNKSVLAKGLSLLFTTPPITGNCAPRVKQIELHQKLVTLLKQTPFELLHNENRLVAFNGDHLNLCGLGEHTLARCQAEVAFGQYDKRYPGIVLTHNPDSVPALKEYPGEIVLCGHTHGGQVNIPGLRQKFMRVEIPALQRGLHRLHDKWVYINRGLGSSMPFRWFSIPELLLLTLERAYA